MIDRMVAPTPEVQHLPTLFRRIDSGEIRIPMFQRGFVWKEAQIVSLFDSVYRGFPIGSLLLWKVDSLVFKQDKRTLIPFPKQDSADFPVSYVLDGMQRLCCLYGAFNYAAEIEAIFNVHFDIDNQKFFVYDPKTYRPPSIPLSSLFSPLSFLKLTKKLADEGNDDHIQAALQLQRTFQEYLVPTVTITNRNPTQVVDIFKRINSTGVALSAVDFVRALVWHPEFDLNDELATMSTRIYEATLCELEDETLTKMIAIALGKEPTAQSMYELHEFPVATLKEAVDQATQSALRALRYLAVRFGIHSQASLPYEGQLLVLASIYLRQGTNIDATLEFYAKWFLQTSLDEELRGKPDHYVARLIKDFARYEQANHFPLLALALTAADLVDRRLIKGKALTIGILVLFFLNKASDFKTGHEISPLFYLTELSADFAKPIVSVESLRQASNAKIISNRIAPNIFLTEEPGGLSSFESAFTNLLSENSSHLYRIAESQFLQPHVLSLLQEGALNEFLLARAQLMVDFAAERIGVQLPG